MCDGWESVGDIAARVVKGVGFAGFGRDDEDRAKRPPKASPRVMTLSADMDPGGVCAGPELKDEAATADGTERIAGRSPPSGAAGEEHRRSRNVIPFPEKGRAPEGAPGQVEGGTDSGRNHSGRTVQRRRATNTGRPPAGFRAHARN